MIEAELYDGTVLEFPDGTDPGVIQSTVKRETFRLRRTPESSVGRGVGLAARTGLNALAQLPAFVADAAITGPVNFVAEKAGFEPPMTGYRELVNQGWTEMGLPEPETDTERAIDRTGEMSLGALFGVGAARQLSERGVNTVSDLLVKFLATNPKQQVVAATAAPIAGEVARQAGASPGLQTAVEIGTGLMVPGDPAMASMARRAKDVVRPDASLGERAQAAVETVGRGVRGTGAASATAQAPGVGTVARGAAGAGEAITTTGQENIVGRVLNASSTDPQAAIRNLESVDELIPGSVPTAGVAARDPGLARAQNAAEATVDRTGAIASQRLAADAARQEALDRAGIRIGTAEKVRDVRDKVGDRLRNQAFKIDQQAELRPVYAEINRIALSPAGSRPEVQSALSAINSMIDDAYQVVNGKPTISARELYEVRKSIRALSEGRLKGYSDRAGAEIINGSTFKQVRGELTNVFEAIDDALERAAPGFNKYRQTFARMSRVADTLEALTDIRKQAMDGTLSEGMLVNAWKREAENVMRNAPPNMQRHVGLMRRVVKDIERGAFIASGKVRGVGSDTAQKVAGGFTIANMIGRAMQKTGPQRSQLIETKLRALRPIDWLLRLPDDQIGALLIDAMQDPKLAARLMAQANQANLETAARELADRANVLGLTAAETRIAEGQ